MTKKVITVTGQRVVVQAVMETGDTLDCIPSLDELREFASEAARRRFQDIDLSDWSTTYRLKSALYYLDHTWGIVEVALYRPPPA